MVTSYEGELILRAQTHGGDVATGKLAVHSRFHVPLGATLMVEDGVKIARDGVLFTWDPYTNPIMTDVAGVVRFVDIVEEETVREELDELTGRRQRVIIEDRDKKLHPHIEVVQKKGEKEKRLRDFVIPEGAQLTVEDGQEVYAGQVLAKVSREAYKTRDITGGLPRVAELFEARRPKDPATISEVDGTVRFGDIKRGKREIYVHAEEGEPQLYEVPAGKHLRVHEGDRVRAGDRLTEGPVNPHDILRIKGPRAVQEYLLNEVQEVYRLQGVKINDKHIGVIVRQMLQKVKTVEPGDTMFLEGENVDKLTFREMNERVVKKGSQARDVRAAAPRDHQGESHDAVVHLGGVVPGDHAGVDRRGDPRGQGRSAGPEGEHHHRPSHSGGDGDLPLPRHRDRAAGGLHASAAAGGDGPRGGAQSVPGGSGSGLRAGG